MGGPLLTPGLAVFCSPSAIGGGVDSWLADVRENSAGGRSSGDTPGGH